MSTKLKTRIFLVTGPPGVGKTTLVRKVCDKLAVQKVISTGFVTEEVRNANKRVGFDVVVLDQHNYSSTCPSKNAVLARINSTGGPSPGQKGAFVGQYQVDVPSFESCVLSIFDPFLKKPSNASQEDQTLLVIDEVGKMELLSRRFESCVTDLTGVDAGPSGNRHRYEGPLLITVPISKGRPLPTVEKLKQHSESKLFEVTRENRNKLCDTIATEISDYFLH